MPTGNAYPSGRLVPSPLLEGGLACALVCWDHFSRLYTDLMTLPKLTSNEFRGFNGALATGVSCQQGALTLPDNWSRTLFGTCLCSDCWDQIPRPCHVFTRLFTLNTLGTGCFIIYDTITKCNNFTYLQQIIFIYVLYCSWINEIYAKK